MHLYKLLFYRWLLPITDGKKLSQVLPAYLRFLRTWQQYQKQPEAEPLRILDSYPALFDNLPTTPYDAHYFYQGIWAFEKIITSDVKSHVDIGSQIELNAYLSFLLPVIFIDIRPVRAALQQFHVCSGNLTSLPFASHSLKSVSCLHVAEHIGLGRYGDTLDPQGTAKACRELVRVIAPGGNLYLSLPVGKSKVAFNAHRIHSPQQILDYCHDLELVTFSGVTDAGEFQQEAAYDTYNIMNYACGLFHFRRAG
ncbi:MAG: DUF268 domain-containing protein [Anaerolineae bacterium]|nr:DUF268 domain-containing protein [Anaerolineae bacterium]